MVPDKLFSEIQVQLNADKLKKFVNDPTNQVTINKRMDELQAPFENTNLLAKLDIVSQSAVARLLHNELKNFRGATSLVFSFHLGYSARLLEKGGKK